MAAEKTGLSERLGRDGVLVGASTTFAADPVLAQHVVGIGLRHAGQIRQAFHDHIAMLCRVRCDAVTVEALQGKAGHGGLV